MGTVFEHLFEGGDGSQDGAAEGLVEERDHLMVSLISAREKAGVTCEEIDRALGWELGTTEVFESNFNPTLGQVVRSAFTVGVKVSLGVQV